MEEYRKAGSRREEIPVWEKYMLSTEEASEYFHIGINKLRRIISLNPTAEWILWNGTRVERNTWGRSFCVDNNGLGRYNQTGDGDGSYRKNHEQKQYLSYHATRNQPAADFS